jgi:hypothetical protein
MILLYLALIFFVLSIEYNIAEKWPSLILRFFAYFLLYIFYLVSVYFYFFDILLECFFMHIFVNFQLIRFFIFERFPDPL